MAMGVQPAALKVQVQVPVQELVAEFIAKFPEHRIMLRQQLTKKITDAADHQIGTEVVQEGMEACFHMGRLTAGPEMTALLRKHPCYGNEFVTLSELATWEPARWRPFLKEADRRCKLANPADRVNLYEDILGEIAVLKRMKREPQ
jgi:hypothetical protein